MHSLFWQRGLIAVAAATVSALFVGCAGPLDRTAEQEMHDHLLASHRLYVSTVAAGPVIELQRAPSDVDSELTDQRRAELDNISGPQAYQGHSLVLGKDLLGTDASKTVNLTLQQAVQLAVKNNLDIQNARLVPAIGQTQTTQAEAAFDAVLFSNFNLQRLDTPRPASTFATSGGPLTANTDTLTTGIQKQLTTGGQITAQTEFDRTFNNPSIYNVNQYYNSNIALSITQPVLRNFGADVNRAKILLADSSRKQSVEDLRKNLLDITNSTEAAYWKLYFTRQRLLIQQRLLTRTIDDYNRIKQREGFDVNPVRKTEAGSFVELRRSEVIRARQDVRIASDALKQLLNAPDLPVSAETMIVPLNEPADAPIQFSLLDAVTTALRKRPELVKTLWQIKDASLRLRVADNLRLPQLNLGATMRYNGLGDSQGGAYGNLTDGNYIDYLLSAQFQMPIGNREAEAGFQQRTLERQSATLAYQKEAQTVVVEVKDSIRNLLTAYELIGAARAARHAAADNLRAIERQEEAGVALTPEFLLDLKLNSQQRLADTETQEIQSMTDYNAAIANYYRTVGTLLEHNGIDFQDNEGK